MYRWFSFFALAIFLTAATPCLAVEVEVVRTLGTDGDDLFLHNPMSVKAAKDGTWFMINAGECQVLHLDADWELLNSFGRCGEGPGEFESPRAMVLYGDEVWLIDDQGEVAWEKNLVTLEENSQMSKSDDGETVTLSVSFLTGNAGLSPLGNYWFTIPSEEEDGPTRIRVTDGQLNRLGEDIVLPDEIHGYEVFFTPDGLVGLVSTGESVVHLCRIGLG